MPGGDDDAVDRGAGLTGPLHQPLSADLQLPQVGIEEQRVELHGAARLEQPGEFGDAVVEDLLGDLAAAGQLGPVAGVGGRGDDLGVDGRRGHAREQDRRASGQPGELGRQLDRAVGQRHRRRRVTRPRGRHLGLGADGEQVALSRRGWPRQRCRCPGPGSTGAVSAGDGVARAQVDDPLRAGVVQALDLGHPVDRAHEDGLGHLMRQFGVDAAPCGPAVDDVDGVGQPRGVEADLDLHAVEHRARTPRRRGSCSCARPLPSR